MPNTSPHLAEVAAGGHRIGEGQLDLLVRADDEHGADGGVVGGGTGGHGAAGGRWEHVVELRDVEVGVADQRIVRRVALRMRSCIWPMSVANVGW